MQFFLSMKEIALLNHRNLQKWLRNHLTADSYLKYKKGRLNPNYLHPNIKAKILSEIKGIIFSKK